jgi:sortase A
MPLNESETKSKFDLSSILVKAGLVILALSFLAFLFFFHPIIIKETMYAIKKPDANSLVELNSKPGKPKEKVIIAVDKEFSIVIPKIGANSKVIKDVDPYNSKEYQQKLTRGVAHAKGTSLPGELGNSFYFAHSSDNFYNANRYNSVFYLLNKLNKDDPFYLVYNGEIFKYKVTDAQVVNAEDINYLESDKNKKTATFMTCWPAGTTLRRYIVVGELQN